MTKEETIHHWLYKGRYESRIYNPKNFCWKSYVKINKDLKDLCKEEAIYHWLYTGINEIIPVKKYFLYIFKGLLFLIISL